MLNLDRTAVETLLEAIEEEGYLFPQYRLYKVNGRLQLLGKGGFSAVYEMSDREASKNRYAVKVMGLERHSVTSDTFQSTVSLQRKLSSQSPGIVRILDAREICLSLDGDGELTGIYDKSEESQREEDIPLQMILMEKLECILEKDRFKNTVLTRSALREETEVIRLALQIGQAIRVAHSNNILHRDIKLENIFWDEEKKRYKLGDFGIAKYAEEGSAETVVYTDGYGAPEIERRLSGSYNATADIYSFGISLYLLLNELRFPGSGGYYVNPVQYDPRFLFPAPEKASGEMTRVIRKMCSYRREDRYQSVEEALADLRCVGSRTGACADRGHGWQPELATETYREEGQSGEDRQKEGLSDAEGDVKVSRAQKRQRQKEIDEEYNRACRRYMLVFSMLFALLLEGMSAEEAFATKWQSWFLLFAVFVTAVMQRIRDFHILFGIATALFGIYSAYATGLQTPHFILLSCVLIGVPALTAAGAFGTGAWMLLARADRLSLSDFFARHDLGWLLLAVILILADRLMELRRKWGKTDYFRAWLWLFIYGKFLLLMIGSGILLSLLQHLGVLTVLEPVSKIHLIRTGIAVFLIAVIRKMGNEEPVEE